MSLFPWYYRWFLNLTLLLSRNLTCSLTFYLTIIRYSVFKWNFSLCNNGNSSFQIAYVLKIWIFHIYQLNFCVLSVNHYLLRPQSLYLLSTNRTSWLGFSTKQIKIDTPWQLHEDKSKYAVQSGFGILEKSNFWMRRSMLDTGRYSQWTSLWVRFPLVIISFYNNRALSIFSCWALVE